MFHDFYQFGQVFFKISLPGNHDISHFGQDRLVKLPPWGRATTVIRGCGPGHEQGRGPRGIGALPIEIRG